jgi:ABC-2 type transport system permease protein
VGVAGAGAGRAARTVGAGAQHGVPRVHHRVAGTLAGIAIPTALADGPQHYTVAVAAQALPAAATLVRAAGNAAGVPVTIVPAADRAAAVRSVEHGRASAAVAAGGEIIWKTGPSSALSPVLTSAVQQAIITQRAASLGLSAVTIARLLAPVRAAVTQLHRQNQATVRKIAAYVAVILMFMAITVYGSYVLTGVVEETSSRIVEVLLSRLPPSSPLGGKIAGIGLAGLAQFLTVAAAAAATLLITRPSGVPPGTYQAIPALVAWFMLGYAFYSTLYGSLGSLTSRTEDAQAAAAPVIALLVAIYVLAIVAIANPSAGWATILSLLPPSAPIIMPLRGSLVYVPAWQTMIAAALMLGAIYVLLRASARLYRNAVLHTGARLHLREAWHGQPARPQPAPR